MSSTGGTDMGPKLGLRPTAPVEGLPPVSPAPAVPSGTEAAFPYLPAPTNGEQLEYSYQVILRPSPGMETAAAHIDRYTWHVDEATGRVFLASAPPLDVTGRPGAPVPVQMPEGVDPSRPQCWVIRESTASEVLVGALPKRPALPLLQVIAGQFPAEVSGDHVMALPPRVDLPEMRNILPCKLQVFPLTPVCGVAVRFRISEGGSPVGLTPYLFRARLLGPKSWNLLSGRKLLEEDPVTGETEELVEATPQAGQLAPVVTVFEGRCVATFSWRASPSAPCFNLAGLMPEERPPEVAVEQGKSFSTPQ